MFAADDSTNLNNLVRPRQISGPDDEMDSLWISQGLKLKGYTILKWREGRLDAPVSNYLVACGSGRQIADRNSAGSLATTGPCLQILYKKQQRKPSWSEI